MFAVKVFAERGGEVLPEPKRTEAFEALAPISQVAVGGPTTAP
jgi:hypothetical protein